MVVLLKKRTLEDASPYKTKGLGNLSFAKGEYPTPLGVISVSCVKNQDGSIKTEWTAPEGIEIICD